MAKSRITFTDGVGAATLQSDYPIPACRFQGWTPKSNPQGQATTAQEDSARAMNRTSWRYGVAFSMHGLGMGAAAGSALDIADRLVGHLLAGGTCAVYTEDVLGTSYATCGLMPGTTPDITLSDDRHLDYSLSLSLINLADVPVPMVAYYGVTSPRMVATGGDIEDVEIDDIIYRVHTFADSGALEVVSGSVDDAEVLIVAGGGAGGGSTNGTRGGGGGAGGKRNLTGVALATGSYAVVVGAGGVSTGNVNASGNDGGASSFDGTAATGGGGGAAANNTGRAGGSGGGGRSSDFAAGTNGGAGTGGQGSAGGNGAFGGGTHGGGGGGAGGAGGGSASGVGGVGESDSITGVAVFYAGGGGDAFALGGNGGGGNGNGSTPGGNGTDGKGGGGAGASGNGGVGGAGGKGVVIVRYRLY